MNSKVKIVGGAVASWLVRSSPDRAVRVRAKAGDIALCSWEKYFTLKAPLYTQVYKWVPTNLMLGVTLRLTSLISSPFPCRFDSGRDRRCTDVPRNMLHENPLVLILCVMKYRVHCSYKPT